jgi:hypothetical protein
MSYANVVWLALSRMIIVNDNESSCFMWLQEWLHFDQMKPSSATIPRYCISNYSLVIISMMKQATMIVQARMRAMIWSVIYRVSLLRLGRFLCRFQYAPFSLRIRMVLLSDPSARRVFLLQIGLR